MATENYLNHPTFGLLFSVCAIEEHRDLFTTLYAQRLFFLVTTSADGVEFEPVSRTDARILIETRMRFLRRMGKMADYQNLQSIYKQTFF